MSTDKRIWVAGFFFALCGVWMLFSPHTLAHAAQSTDTSLQFDASYRVEDRFSSHLPVAVVQEDGTVAFYTGSNTVLFSSNPTHEAEITSINDTSELAAKPDYTLTFQGQTQNELGKELWGWAGFEPDWYLLGNGQDKSLVRNYLAYTLAASMNEMTPEVHFVEVLEEQKGASDDGVSYLYQGVYLLIAPQDEAGYYLARGEPGEGDLMLYTYAFLNGYVDEPLYVPERFGLTEDERYALEQGVSQAESVIYSTDYNVFGQYARHLDNDKAVDYFIINELFGNYDGAEFASYRYDLDSGMLWPILSSNFDNALDNDPENPFDFSNIELMETPYYDSLVQSTVFIRDVQKRYYHLYQESLSPTAIEAQINEAVALLGNAQTRDWTRWETEYGRSYLDSELPTEQTLTIDNAVKPVFDRNAQTYDGAIIQIKHAIYEHGLHLFQGIGLLFQEENLVGEDASYVQNTLFFIGFLLVFYLSIAFVRRRTR